MNHVMLVTLTRFILSIPLWIRDQYFESWVAKVRGIMKILYEGTCVTKRVFSFPSSLRFSSFSRSLSPIPPDTFVNLLVFFIFLWVCSNLNFLFFLFFVENLSNLLFFFLFLSLSSFLFLFLHLLSFLLSFLLFSFFVAIYGFENTNLKMNLLIVFFVSYREFLSSFSFPFPVHFFFLFLIAIEFWKTRWIAYFYQPSFLYPITIRCCQIFGTKLRDTFS